MDGGQAAEVLWSPRSRTHWKTSLRESYKWAATCQWACNASWNSACTIHSTATTRQKTRSLTRAETSRRRQRSRKCSVNRSEFGWSLLCRTTLAESKVTQGSVLSKWGQVLASWWLIWSGRFLNSPTSSETLTSLWSKRVQILSSNSKIVFLKSFSRGRTSSLHTTWRHSKQGNLLNLLLKLILLYKKMKMRSRLNAFTTKIRTLAYPGILILKHYTSTP